MILKTLWKIFFFFFLKAQGEKYKTLWSCGQWVRNIKTGSRGTQLTLIYLDNRIDFK